MTTEKSSTGTQQAPEGPADQDMTEKEKRDLFDQMEEFEGPQRREIRGDDAEPPHDPGVAHS